MAIFQFSRWWLFSILDIWKFKILMMSRVKAYTLHHCAKVHGDLSDHCWDMVICRFLNGWLSAVLDGYIEHQNWSTAACVWTIHKEYLVMFITCKIRLFRQIQVDSWHLRWCATEDIESVLQSTIWQQEYKRYSVVVRYWHGHLSGERCKWFACGPADATATPSSLALLKSRIVFPFWCLLTQVFLEKGH